MGSDENYNWYAQADLSKYAGNWVAIAHRQVVSYGNDLKKLYVQAKEKYPDEEPLLARVPKPRLQMF